MRGFRRGRRDGRHAAARRTAPGRPHGRVGTRARGPEPEAGALARHLAIVPGVLALLGAIAVAPHALDEASRRLRAAPFLVERIELQGLERVAATELREALAPARGVPLVDLDVASLVGSVEAHPWVAEAAALRWPPDTLRVRVVEREPLAVTAAGEAGALHAVDRTGTAFAPAAEPDATRLVAIAFDPPARVGEPDPRLLEGLRLAARFGARGMEVPRRVTLGLPGRAASAELRLRGFAPAIFIQRDAPEAQLDRLARLLRANVGPALVARVIDLRFDGRAVLWEGS